MLVQVAVLLWGESQRDIEMCKEVLEQVRAFPFGAVEKPVGRILGVHVCTCAMTLGWDRAEAVLKATSPGAVQHGCTFVPVAEDHNASRSFE